METQRIVLNQGDSGCEIQFNYYGGDIVLKNFFFFQILFCFYICNYNVYIK